MWCHCHLPLACVLACNSIRGLPTSYSLKPSSRRIVKCAGHLKLTRSYMAKYTVRVSKLLLRNCVLAHGNCLEVLPHINLYLSTRRPRTIRPPGHVTPRFFEILYLQEFCLSRPRHFFQNPQKSSIFFLAGHILLTMLLRDHDGTWLTGRAVCELPMGFGQPGQRTGFMEHALRVVEAWWLYRRDHRSRHPSLCRYSCRYDRGGPRGGSEAARPPPTRPPEALSAMSAGAVLDSRFRASGRGIGGGTASRTQTAIAAPG